MKSNSSGSVPKKVGKKRANYERSSNVTMQAALNAALKRLGDPVVDFRSRRNLIVKRAHRSKD